ncbi:MAG: purine-binding chemotaxis protein CheW [Spirochaetales bacterium]|nr:purine-binding chemotaxis protein CheW [Spirochaetales bacterium]
MGKFLVFTIDADHYAIDISKVREIIRFESITPIRDALEYIKGVINLRGKIIPIYDLRTKFGMEQKPYDQMTVFIIVDIQNESESYNVGLAVDAVHEVFDIAEEEIQHAPDVGLKMKTQFLHGVVNIHGKLAMMLELNKIINTQEIIHLMD